MQNNWIIRFDQSAALDMAGGKGLNLARLAQAGMPVPPGFIVSTSAYTDFVTHNHLDEQLQATFTGLQQGQSLKECAIAIRSAFEQGEFSAELAAEITRAYRELAANAAQNGLPVAVRSSATAEDLAEASFAGQQDTYLNIHGQAQVLDAVRRCFGSLWSERAIDYRARQGLAPLGAQLAVVVQQMIFAEAAGVVFTANPLTGDAHQLVIDAVFGLGEALVSGLVTPDHILVDKRSGEILTYNVAEKIISIRPSGDGTHEQALGKLQRKARVLKKAQVRELAQLGAAIEAVYGKPQDLEWCLAQGKLYVVQARPITTLPAHPVSWDAPGPGQWLHGGGSFEMITEPITPLFETFLLPIFVDEIIQMVAGIGLAGALPEVPYRVVNGHIYLHLQMHLRPWNLPGVIKDFAMHMNSMKDQVAEQDRYRITVEGLQSPAVANLSGEQILERMQALGTAGMHYWLQIMKLVQVIYRQEKAFTDFYTQHARQAGDPEPEIFLRGQKILPWEAECSTFELAQLARQTPAVVEALRSAPERLASLPEATIFNAALAAHLERYGHQLSSFDLALPTLADDPRPVLSAVLAFVDGKESPYLRQEHMHAESEQAIATLFTHLDARHQKKVRQLLTTAQNAAALRENALFLVGLAWTPMHRCALELGRRMAGQQVIAQASDIFWLTQGEIRTALRTSILLAEQVTQRQANNQLWSQVTPPYILPVSSQAAFWWSWIFPTPELQRHPDAHTLIGLGVSPGKVTAVARVIHALDEMDQLQPGEILVARTTTPAWTPLFARAAGLVTDLGGPLAHGSIVAREVGIPAVMGTGVATQKIRSGQTITVLGSEGRVLMG